VRQSLFRRSTESDSDVGALCNRKCVLINDKRKTVTLIWVNNLQKPTCLLCHSTPLSVSYTLTCDRQNTMILKKRNEIEFKER